MQREIAQVLYPSAVGPFSRPAVRLRPSTALGGALVVLLAAVAFGAVQVTGGSPNTLNHLGYGSIVVAAYLFGWKGAVPAAIFSGLLLGPGAAVVPDHAEPFRSWFPRLAMFVAMGSVLGALFDLSRHAGSGWRKAAIEVAERERDGMLALARGAEAKDTDTGQHILRVQRSAEELAVAAGMDRSQAAAVGWAAMLHDVGKLHIPDAILLKPGSLTSEERAIMEQHPIYGERILADGPGFAMARRIARWHHENVDGSGYPDRLRGEQIPFEARIVRVADALDAMTHARPYRTAQTLDYAIDQLRRNAGRQFDPELVALMIELLGQSPYMADAVVAVSKPAGAARGEKAAAPPASVRSYQQVRTDG